MASERQARTWQEAEADALQVYVDELDALVYQVRRVEGKWKDRPEFRNASQVLVDLCRTEAENVERQIEELKNSIRPQAVRTSPSE